MDSGGVQGWKPSTLNDALVAEIKAEQSALGFTNDQLADRAHMDRQSVGRYLRRTRQINVENAAKLAAALDLKASELHARAEARLARVTAQQDDSTVHNDDLPDDSVTPLEIDRRRTPRTRQRFDDILREAGVLGEDSTGRESPG